MTSLALGVIVLAIDMLIGLVFLTAAVGKMRNWQQFVGVVGNYRLLPEVLIAPVAYALPPLEAVLGAALLLHVGSPWPQWVALGLLLLFGAAMAVNMRRGRREIDCGCFQSALRQPLSWTLVVRNLALALVSGLAALAPPLLVDTWILINAMLVTAVLFMLLQTLNILWSIVPSWRRAPGQTSGAHS
jgi:hypothetical protein